MSEVVLHKGTEPPTPDPGYITIFADQATGNLRYKKENGSVGDFIGQSDPELKAITVEIPGTAENISFFFTEVALTAYKVNVVLKGTAPSLTWSLRHGTDRSAAGSELITGGTVTTNTTTGETITVFDDPTIVANSHIWFTTTAKSGVVDSVSLTFYYNED